MTLYRIKLIMQDGTVEMTSNEDSEQLAICGARAKLNSIVVNRHTGDVKSFEEYHYGVESATMIKTEISVYKDVKNYVI